MKSIYVKEQGTDIESRARSEIAIARSRICPVRVLMTLIY